MWPRRHLFMFEMHTDAGAGDPGAAAEPAAAVDPGAGAEPVTPGAAAPAPASAPGWTPDDPEFLFAVDQAVQARLAGYGQQQQPEEPGLQLDPWAEDYGQQLAGLIAAVVGQQMAPLQAAYEAQQVEAGNQQAQSILGGFTDLGAYDKAQAFSRAQDIFTGMVNQYGPEYATVFEQRALRQAAEQQASFEKTVREQAIADYKQQLAQAAGGGEQVDVGVAGAAGEITGAPKTYDEVIARWGNRAPSRVEAFQS